jgi:hypothetical protein
MTLFRVSLGAVVLAAAIGTAQTKAGDIVVDVPFAFVVPGQNFPAEHSVVTPENEVGLRISNSNGQSRSVPTPHSLRSQSDGSSWCSIPMATPIFFPACR